MTDSAKKSNKIVRIGKENAKFDAQPGWYGNCLTTDHEWPEVVHQNNFDGVVR